MRKIDPELKALQPSMLSPNGVEPNWSHRRQWTREHGSSEPLSRSRDIFGFKTVPRLSESCSSRKHDSESRGTVKHPWSRSEQLGEQEDVSVRGTPR